MDYGVEDLAKGASEVLNKVGVIVYPTETVYGLGGNALEESVVSKIFKIKGRPEGKPFIVLVRDLAMAKGLIDLGEYEETLKKYWPGALTGVFKAITKLPSGVVSKGGTVAIRISPHPFVQKLFGYIDFPIISTSANKSGDENSSTISEVKESLGLESEMVDYFVDWGSLNNTLPSTLVSFVSNTPKIMRQGSIIFL